MMYIYIIDYIINLFIMSNLILSNLNILQAHLTRFLM